MNGVIGLLALGLTQALPPQPRALTGDATPLAWVVTHPDRARDSIRIWMAAAVRATPSDAERQLARAGRVGADYLRVWGDSFPLRDLQRFLRLSPEARVRRVRADSLRRSGNAALGSAGFAAAARDWHASYDLASALRDTAVMAAALGNIGAGFYRESQLDSAAWYFTEARRLAGTAGDRRTELNALGGLASVSKDRGDLEAAARRYRDGLLLRRQIGDYRGVAADANNLGLIAAAMGKAAEARRRYVEALVTAREHGLDEAAATALLNLGTLASSEGDAREAAQRYRDALALYRTLGDSAGQALVLRNVGLMQAGTGDLPTAAASYQQAIALLERTGPVEVLAGTYVDLSQVFAAMGNLDRADRALGEASRLVREHGLSQATAGRLRVARGDLALDFSQVNTAREHYQAGLDLLRQARDRAGEAEALAALGWLSMVEEDYRNARLQLLQAAAAQQTAGDSRAAALNVLLAARAGRAGGMAAMTAGRGQVLAAVDTLRASGDRVALAWGLCELGNQQQARGRQREAEAAYREGLTHLGRTPAVGPSVCLYGGLGQVLKGRGALREAVTALTRGIAATELAASGVNAAGRRSDFLSDKWELYTDLALAQVALGDQAEAFETSERLRARQILGLITDGPGATPAPEASHPRLAALRRRITELLDLSRTRETAIALRGSDAPAELSDRQGALRRAESEYSELLDSLEGARRGTPLRPVPTTGWREIAARLPADAALVEYLVTDSTALAFVVLPSRLSVVRLPVTGTDLTATLDFVRGQLSARASSRPGAPWEAPLRRLHGQLIAPIEQAGLLRGTTRLLLVPHRELHYLPFAALLEAGAGGQFLAQRYQIAQVASGAVWLGLQARPARSAGQRILALAPHPEELPGTRSEVRAIGNLYGADARIVIGPRATSTLLAADAPGRSILHLASRGILNRHNPRFSYVALAPDGQSDGRLEVHEVSRLAIDADLVVLSACQTGLGAGRVIDVPPGDDWVGLVQAFQSAGARNVLATLWPVDDRATAEVMVQFYRALRTGHSAAGALAEAQRAAIANGATRSPFYWAGFVLEGGL